MSDASILNSYIEKYNDNLMLLSQQESSRLRAAVMSSSQSGEGAAPVDQVAAAEAIDINTRYQVKPLIETVHDRRWEHPVSKGWGDIVDEIDKLKVNIELNGAYTKTGINAINREIDKEIISRFFASALTGRSGGTSTALPAGNTIGVQVGGSSSDVGLNTDKLLAAREVIMAGDVDIDNTTFYCGINARQERNLLEEIKIINGDYGVTQFDGTGTKLRSWFGINFIHTELYETDSNSDLQVPFWVPEGMHLGIWQDVKGDISERKDLNLNPMHISVNATFGATRVEEAKVVRILCDES